MIRFLWICLGGAIGTGARYALSMWARELLGGAFPYGTLAVNVLGSFLLGLVMSTSTGGEVLSPTARLALGTGMMGGFTTYSTFNYETIQLFRDRGFLMSFINVAVTLLGCLMAGWLGLYAGKRALGQ